MKLILLFSIFTLPILHAQTDTMPSLPYYEIPAAPTSFNACTVAARMVDGLGFRYYWATEGLRAEDLQFKPTPESRTTGETITHIHGLVKVVLHAVKEMPNVRPAEEEELSFADQRTQTLMALKEASDLLRTSALEKMDDFDIVFQRGDQSSSFPFWNILNGPLADAMWHVGQVVSHRRSSGNPMSGNISVFSGTVKKGK